MKISVSFEIEVDEKEYKNLTKKQIREIVKSMETGNGCKDYIESNARNELEMQNHGNK